MKNVKRNLFVLTAFVCCVLFGLDSCLGDKGNVTTSYGTGTILYDTSSNLPCLLLDDINLYVTGAGLPVLEDSLARAFVYYSIDWDNQPSDADTRNIYDATFTQISTWEINAYEVGTPEDFDFKATDTIRNIAKPFISYKTGMTPNLLSVDAELYASGGTLRLMQQNIPDDPAHYMGVDTDTLLIVYEGGEYSKETVEKWFTFRLPDYPKKITSVVLLFRSVSSSGFSPVWKSDLGGSIYKITTSFTDSDEEDTEEE
ncbi:MAG: hypothetical protein LUI04_06310 [Porphyromonadaceae bacterium]|nr:hypothetical protein [Porphyromonadaceae bacterium]